MNKLRDELSWDEQGRNPANNMAATVGHFSKLNKNIVPPLIRRHKKKTVEGSERREHAGYRPYLLFSTLFSKVFVTPGRQNRCLISERLTLYLTMTTFDVLEKDRLTHSLIHHTETVPNSKKLQMTRQLKCGY